MTDRLRRIEDLYHRASELGAPERAAFLREACRDDPGLRREVESLLAGGNEASGFMQSPDVERAAQEPATSGALGEGDRVGAFIVRSLVGRGGMGEVYRARDVTLGRDVALKVLPLAFSRDRERVVRFQREAEALASLNHPNIGTIHGVEESGGRKLLVLEFVEGVTLAERLKKGAIPIKDALRIALQIAEALEAAHEKGVIHRDIKPANIKITPEGRVKVLDFGLAKAFPTDSLEDSPTRSVTVSQPGAVMGTPAYMSPEQVRGDSVDRRADIWAFGCVLHEMLTGKSPFASATLSETLVKVLDGSPDFSVLPPEAPPPIVRLLQRCLKKETRERLQHVGDARLEIADALAASGTGAPGRPEIDRGPSRRALAALAALCAVGLAAVVLYVRQDVPTPLETRFDVPIPGDDPETARFELSPDGRTLAIAAVEGGQRGLWLRPLDRLDAQLVPGTEGAEAVFWSPDSAQVGFFADGRLKRAPVATGKPVLIAEIGPTFEGASWNREGEIVFSSNGLKRVDSAGGAVRPAAAGDFEFPSFPHYLPDGVSLLFRGNRPRADQSGIFVVGSLDGSSPAEHLSTAWSNVVYAPGLQRHSGLLLFSLGALMAQGFDPRERRVTGDPFTVVELIAGAPGRGHFSVSARGDLAYRRATLFQWTWVDRAGTTHEEVGSAGPRVTTGGALSTARLSPDETKVAYSGGSVSGGAPNSDVWVLDLLRNVPQQITFAPGPDLVPVWSPDGREIVFTSNRNRPTNFDSYIASLDGDERLLVEMPGGGWPLDRSPDGQIVLQNQGDKIWTVPVDGGPPELYLEVSTPAARFSPNTQWVAYVSDGDVYVSRFPDAGRPQRVSPAGGAEPQWRGDGRELFYVAGDGTLTAVPVTDDGSTIRFGPQTRLFPSAAGYQASADGRRFLLQRPVDPRGPAITVVLNWQAVVEGLRGASRW